MEINEILEIASDGCCPVWCAAVGLLTPLKLLVIKTSPPGRAESAGGRLPAAGGRIMRSPLNEGLPNDRKRNGKL